PTGTDANYIGAGVAAGVTNGGQDNDAATFGGNIQGRVTTSKAPVSLRGAVLFSDDTSAIMPMVSYDVPVTNNANVYVGAGYSFVEEDGQPTPLGNKNAPVVTVGAEAQLGRNVVVYGDTKLGIEAYEDSPASAVSIQAGAGYRF
ncbi:MAG: outer membrane beta-barrel protein, partial [Coleofasciculus sp. C2-GNP5-27]